MVIRTLEDVPVLIADCLAQCLSRSLETHRAHRIPQSRYDLPPTFQTVGDIPEKQRPLPERQALAIQRVGVRDIAVFKHHMTECEQHAKDGKDNSLPVLA